jgi:hypothetical protein
MIGRNVVLASFTLILAPLITLTQIVDDVDPVCAAARKRQEAVRTLVIELKSTTYRAKGIPPAEEKDSSSNIRLIIAAESVRREEDQVWFINGVEAHRSYHVSAFDGVVAKRLFSNKGNGVNTGVIVRGEQAATEVSLPVPIATAFRGLPWPPKHGSVAHLRPTGGSTIIDGATCLEYVLPSARGTGRVHWFEPGHDFVLRRTGLLEEGQIGRQLDVRYDRRADIGWVPSGWTEVWRMLARTTWRSEVEIVKFECNRPQAGEQFDITFPPGTIVSDESTHKEMVVQPDGSFAPVEQPAPAPPPGPPWHMRNHWVSYAVFGVLVAIVAVLFVIRTRKAKTR